MALPYRSYTLAGRPLVIGATVIPREVEMRFLARLPANPDPDACWPLRRGVSTPAPPCPIPDYTLLQWTAEGQKHSIPAHRFALLRERGYISPDLMALHRCNNRPCCNSRHLYLGTAADNEADKLRDPVSVGRYLDRAMRSPWSPAAKDRARVRAAALGIFYEAA